MNIDPNLERGLNYLKEVARYNGLGLTVTSTRRSYEQQARLYRDYLNGRSRWPAAPPGTSKHERGLAFDAVVQPRSEEAQRWFGQLWERMGGRWGGRFNDDIHFEI